MPFTETKFFSMIKLKPKLMDTAKGAIEIESHEIVMKFPSKHIAHTLL